MGKPDPFLCFAALYADQGPQDRVRKRKCGERAGRQYRRLYQRLFEMGEPGTAAGKGRTGCGIRKPAN